MMGRWLVFRSGMCAARHGSPRAASRNQPGTRRAAGVRRVGSSAPQPASAWSAGMIFSPRSGTERIVAESTLNTRISAVRSAIGDNGDDQRLSRTFFRKGFRFMGAVREDQEPTHPEPEQALVRPHDGVQRV